MPTYEYKCQTCDHRFDVVQTMSSPKLTDCPVEGCDGAVKRLLGTGAGIIFKGSGFYQTDYRSDSYKEGAKKAETASKGESSGGSSDSGSKKTEAKPAAKPAKKSPAKKD